MNIRMINFKKVEGKKKQQTIDQNTEELSNLPGKDQEKQSKYTSKYPKQSKG